MVLIGNKVDSFVFKKNLDAMTPPKIPPNFSTANVVAAQTIAASTQLKLAEASDGMFKLIWC